MWKPTPHESYFLTHLPQTIAQYPDAPLAQAFHWTQMESKLWALRELEKLQKPFELIYILAGWYSVMASLLLNTEFFSQAKIRSFDRDPSCWSIAESLHLQWVVNNWQFKATTADITQMTWAPCRYSTIKSDGSEQLLVEEPDLVVNTSCEHIDNFSQWRYSLPQGRTVLLQSNNDINQPGHINCSESLAEFLETCSLKSTFYSGEKSFPSYQRYMVIGTT